MKDKPAIDKLKDDVHYLIVTHCKYKDMSMYDRALKQFQKRYQLWATRRDEL